ncbi:uracil-DNA glycosylase family protein [Sphingomonas sp.]|uniref:uracil-DNA glycosylase family protein n=1 Tax=Sphingomonas sp. TaxID=28214 RepID=UPI0035C85C82
MGADQKLDWGAAAASALDWWRDAGVDVVVGDAPVNWLEAKNFAPASEPEPPNTREQLDARAAPGGRAAPPATPAPALPESLAEFVTWRSGREAPDAVWAGEAIGWAGPDAPSLMVLVDCPERDDRGQLLGGEVGRLFDNMLRSIGLKRADILLASVCVRRPTTGRVPRELEQRLGEVARHHLSLAAPKALLVLGDAATRAVLGTNVAGARERLHSFNHKNGTSTQVIASHHPRVLLDRPACKSEAWKDLILFNSGLSK